jgi:hypothetical protein
MATSTSSQGNIDPGANGAQGTSIPHGNGSELDVFTAFDGNLSKTIISAQMKEIETMLKLPTCNFDYPSFQELILSLASSQGIAELYQNAYVAPAANAAPPDDMLKRKVNLAWAILLHVGTFASMRQLIIRGRAKEKNEKTLASHIHITFKTFLKRLCLLKNEDSIDPVREWDLLKGRIENDRNETTAKLCILKEHYMVIDHIDRVADLSATMTPPRPYTDHEKISKYLQCIGDTLRGKLQMGNLATNGKAWDAIIEEIPTLIATQRRLEKEPSQNLPATINNVEQQKESQKDTDSDVDSQTSSSDEDSDEDKDTDSDVDSQTSSSDEDSNEEEDNEDDNEDASQGSNLSEDNADKIISHFEDVHAGMKRKFDDDILALQNEVSSLHNKVDKILTHFSRRKSSGRRSTNDTVTPKDATM